jgi:uncharacterized membrane protein YccC
VLLACSCLPVAVLEWDDVQRRAGLCAVTVYGLYVVATLVQQLVTESYRSDAPDSAVALGCALVMVAAAHLCQRFRARRPDLPPQAASSRAS